MSSQVTQLGWATRAAPSSVLAATHNPFFFAANVATEVALSRFLSSMSLSVQATEWAHIHSAAQHEKSFKAIEARKPIAAALAMVRVIKDGLKYAPKVAVKPSLGMSA